MEARDNLSHISMPLGRVLIREGLGPQQRWMARSMLYGRRHVELLARLGIPLHAISKESRFLRDSNQSQLFKEGNHSVEHIEEKSNGGSSITNAKETISQ